MGGTPSQMAHACAMALSNTLGLVCDPVAGLVEVPCVKRNVIGAVNAASAADMALAGIESRVPVDQVIDCMGDVGRRMPVEVRETALGGLAATPFGGEAFTSLGVPFRVQRPALYDLVMGIKRQTQIMYPKDMGLICFKLGVGPGRTILEAGSGSGGFTLALSWFAGPSGRVHTFEAREEFHKLAPVSYTHLRAHET